MSEENKYWKEAKKSEHMLFLHDAGEFPEFTIYLKWDGCADLDRYFNGTYLDDAKEDVDTIHLCEIDELIERLQEAKRLAKEHFGPKWPNH